MSRKSLFQRFAVWPVMGAIAAALFCVFVQVSLGASWNNIEPFKTRRADVRQQLGTPVTEPSGEGETLRFKIPGATVTVAFVSDRLIAARGLAPSLKGTVSQLAVQHDNSAETPQTLKLTDNENFTLEDRQGVAVYTNTKEGIIYTFVNGKLTTTWYNPTAEQLVRAQTKK